MIGFYQHNGCWLVDGVSIADIALTHPTPCYVYSRSALVGARDEIKKTFHLSRPTICHAVKANDNLSLLSLLAEEGGGFDIVSGGELARALAAGGRAADVVFSGVGKSVDDIKAALAAGIGCFNVESAPEMERIAALAAAGDVAAPIAPRVTFNIDGGTHRHLTTGLAGGKFGVSADEAIVLAKRAIAHPSLNFLGYSCHVGSQIADENVYLRLAAAMAAHVEQSDAAGAEARQINMGGGFAVDESAIMPPPPSLSRYDESLARFFPGRRLLIEPGRAIFAAAGALLTRVEYVKRAGDKTIWVVDAGMNNLLRPAMYGAKLPLAPVRAGGRMTARGDVVGPVCESADVIAADRELSLAAGDLLLIFNVGAYGETMSSNYNARPRAAALLAHDGETRTIRRAETINDMLAAER